MNPFDCCKRELLNTTLVLSPKRRFTQDSLAFTQRLAGDPAGARIRLNKRANTLEPLCINQPENDALATLLSETYAILGDKNCGPEGSGACHHALAEF